MLRKLLFSQILFIGILLFTNPLALISNNLTISNVSLTGQNAAENYAFIRFDISWENSWRTSTAPNNHDAAWVFAKYRIGSGTWNHVMLSPSGHIAPAGSTVEVPSDLVGAFFYRDADGSGAFTKTGVKLRWNYGASGIGDDDVVDVKVFGLEMVYVPEGAFWVGSTTGGNEAGRFYTYPNTDSPYQVSSEDEIVIGTSTGNLNYVVGSQTGDNLGPAPASYPKGYNAFYVMKHEIPHHAYVDFLNCLTRDQQQSRTQANLSIGVSSVTNTYVMVNIEVTGSLGSPIPVHRSSIRCDASIPANDPITFYCDLNQNGIPNEVDDGQHIACIYINWSDTKAYLDWSGLRPMSELEFEKACRGPLLPVAQEYAWGTASISNYSSLINPGTANEISNSATANSTFRNAVLAPSRVGMFAKPGNTRAQSGATYYGILDMSGNLWERPVNLGTPEGRNFTGLHGNGILTSSGDADVTNWPPNNGEGTGFRGGYWDSSQYEDPMRIAGRTYSDDPVERRRNRFGGRGVRTAPSN
ncbi:MAG: hypothetical protein FD170_3726 [Bacteroidetes bacterium]|nr:MAG: hypothetical protein FD170_3726 [Bacteroidota bacterium]